MGKKETKLFKEGLKFRKGKDGTKRSEEELLYLLYTPEEVKAAEDRIIDKQIAKRDKKEAKKRNKLGNNKENTLTKDVSQGGYQYRRIIPENGRINEMGITEKDYNDPNFKGYKQRYLVTSLIDENGNQKIIKAGHKGEYTKKEQEEYDKIMKAKKDLEKMQKAFEGEEK